MKLRAYSFRNKVLQRHTFELAIEVFKKYTFQYATDLGLTLCIKAEDRGLES